MVEIPTRDEFKKIIPLPVDIISYTDGSKLSDTITGAGILIKCKTSIMKEESIHLGLNGTAFQAEIFAVGRAAEHLSQFNVSGRNIIINCDSHADILALDSHIIKTNSTFKAVQALKIWQTLTRYILKMDPGTSGLRWQ